MTVSSATSMDRIKAYYLYVNANFVYVGPKLWVKSTLLEEINEFWSELLGMRMLSVWRLTL